MTPKPRLIARAAVLTLIALAILAVLPDLAAVLFPPAQAKLTDPNIAMVALAVVAEPLAYSIRAFCRAHGISIPTYYELKKQDLGLASATARKYYPASTGAVWWAAVIGTLPPRWLPMRAARIVAAKPKSN